MMERIAFAGENLEIWKVHHTDVREQDQNARVMPPEMLDRLIENVKKEGRLESLPLGVIRGDDKPYVELISGHHRTRAAAIAGVTEFLVLVDTRDLSPDQVRAKQLAHNSISGRDNDAMLRQIFDQITAVDQRLEAFVQVDDKYLSKMAGAMAAVTEEIAIKWPVLSFAFLPTQNERFKALAARLVKQVPKDTDQLWLLPEEVAKQFSTLITKTGRKFDIRTTGNIIAKIVDLAHEQLNSEATSAEPKE